MAEASRPPASRHVFRLRGRIGFQDIKACAGSGLYGQDLAEPVADIHDHSVTSASCCLEAGREGLDRREGTQSVVIPLRTLHFSHWVPFENHHIGFFTVFDGDMESTSRTSPTRPRSSVRYALSTCRWRAADASSKERPGVLSVGTGKQLSSDWVVQRLSRPLGSRH